MAIIHTYIHIKHCSANKYYSVRVFREYELFLVYCSIFFITFLFCRPSYPELAALTEVKGEKNEPLQDVKTIPGNEDIPGE